MHPHHCCCCAVGGFLFEIYEELLSLVDAFFRRSDHLDERATMTTRVATITTTDFELPTRLPPGGRARLPPPRL